LHYLLYAPSAQLPLTAALSCLVLFDYVGPRRVGRFAPALTFVGLWALCLGWLWDPQLRANVATGLGVAFALAMQGLSLAKSRMSVASSGRRLTLNLLVAAVLTFAFPMIVLMIACGRGSCN
jgi:hypothetical protein